MVYVSDSNLQSSTTAQIYANHKEKKKFIAFHNPWTIQQVRDVWILSDNLNLEIKIRILVFAVSIKRIYIS